MLCSRVLFVGLLTLLLMGCVAKGGGQERVKGYETVALEESLSLAVLDSIQLKDGDTQFWIRVEEVQDNRCPKDVNCITGGSATVQFAIEHQPEVVELCIGADCRGQENTLMFEHNTKKYKVVLEEVVPYPETGATTETKQAIFKIKQATS